MLRAADLIDDQLRWKGAKDHLVLCGDLLDRGPDDRRVLDLVQALQEEARRAGGCVHVLVGNHEALNLARDLRYVSPESYAAFAPEEESGARRKAWDGFRKALSRPGLDEASLKAATLQPRSGGNHIAVVRQNQDGVRTPLTMPSHRTMHNSTLRTIIAQAGIPEGLPRRLAQRLDQAAG